MGHAGWTCKAGSPCQHRGPCTLGMTTPTAATEANRSIEKEHVAWTKVEAAQKALDEQERCPWEVAA